MGTSKYRAISIVAKLRTLLITTHESTSRIIANYC